jgi:hypothetical protein
VSYTPPSVAGSGVTWAQLRSQGFHGTLALIAQANGLPPALASRIKTSDTVANSVRAYAELVDHYLSGDPIDGNEVKTRMTDLAKVFHALAQTADDINSLIDANPGTVHDVVSAPVAGRRIVRRQRTWP